VAFAADPAAIVPRRHARPPRRPARAIRPRALPSSWLTKPEPIPYSEDVVNEHILDGLGGSFAIKHPEWVVLGAQLATDLAGALLAYQDDPNPDAAEARKAELQAAYTALHDLRAAEYTTGYGTKGKGNFLWQYVMSFGPLAQSRRCSKRPR
jgi:hypothetical protein